MSILQRISYKRIIVHCSIFFLLTLIIISPELVFSLRESSIKEILVNFVLIELFLLIPFIFFYKNLTIYYFLIAIYCSLTPILFLPVILINEKISPEIIIAALNSNFQEINELLGWKLLLLFALMIVFFSGAFYLTKFLPKKTTFKTGLRASIIGTLFFTSVIYATGDKSVSYFSNLKLELPKIYPLGLISSTYSIIKTNHLEDDYLKNTANFSFGSFKTRTTNPRTIQVLVIGESSRYDHWAINGYSRNTSPFLSTEKNLITFSKVVTGATLTLKSIPFLITRVSVDNISNHLKEKSVMAAFKEAGFYTAWISNQNGANKSVTSEFHTADADTTIFTNLSSSGDKSFMTPGLYDESIVEPFKNLINNTSTDLFIVIHTMGSHWRYKFRYPSEYNIFKPNKNSVDTGNDSLSELIDEYDNSILYTDHILKVLINELKEANAVGSLIYISDHGENLKDNGSELMYHSATPTFYTAQVPLFIWMSDNLKKQRPEIEMALSMNKDKPVSTVRSIFYTTLDVAGINIKIDSNLKRYSLASLGYENTEQRISGESNVICSFKNLPK